MDPDSLLQQSPDYSVEEIDGETLLYRLGSHQTIHLNETASLIWSLCDGTRSLRMMMDELRGLFPDAAAEIEADVQEAVSRLADEGAVVAAG